MNFLVPYFMRVTFPKFPNRDFPEHHVGGFFGDHDNGCVRIAGYDPRHHRGINYPEFLYSTDPTQPSSKMQITSQTDYKHLQKVWCFYDFRFVHKIICDNKWRV